jgi:hypothetical protein
MDLGVERPGGRSLAQRRDRFRMPPLSGEGDPEVERRIRVLGAAIEHETKRALGLGELLLLQVLPSVGEAGVDARDWCRSRVTTGSARKRGPRDGKKLSETHGAHNCIPRATCCSARNARRENDLTLHERGVLVSS